MTKNKTQFVDEEREVMDEFYDLMENGCDSNDMKELIDKDPDFFDPYFIVSEDLYDEGKEWEARRLERDAFERALELIRDEEGNWPDNMRWGVMGNRHIIRALMRGADNLWKEGKNEDALDIYRKLLKSNFSDNIGARFAIIALRMGLSYDEYERQVWPNDAVPAKQIDDWFKENASKYPEELEEWEEYCRKEFGL